MQITTRKHLFTSKDVRGGKNRFKKEFREALLYLELQRFYINQAKNQKRIGLLRYLGDMYYLG